MATGILNTNNNYPSQSPPNKRYRTANMQQLSKINNQIMQLSHTSPKQAWASNRAKGSRKTCGVL